MPRPASIASNWVAIGVSSGLDELQHVTVGVTHL